MISCSSSLLFCVTLACTCLLLLVQQRVSCLTFLCFYPWVIVCESVRERQTEQGQKKWKQCLSEVERFMWTVVVGLRRIYPCGERIHIIQLTVEVILPMLAHMETQLSVPQFWFVMVRADESVMWNFLPRLTKANKRAVLVKVPMLMCTCRFSHNLFLLSPSHSPYSFTFCWAAWVFEW